MVRYKTTFCVITCIKNKPFTPNYVVLPLLLVEGRTVIHSSYVIVVSYGELSCFICNHTTSTLYTNNWREIVSQN